MSDAAQASDVRGVEVAGPSDGKPIVFVHGVMFTKKQWTPQRRDLTDEFRYVAMDLPGHGEDAAGDFRFEAALDRLDEVIEAVADGSAAVVGLSLGGYVATEYARRHPDKVDVLVISGSSANPVGILGKVTRVVSRIANHLSESDLAVRAVSWMNARFTGSLDLEPDVVTEILDAGFYPEQFGRAGVQLAGRDFRAAFGAFPGPALILNGKWDLVNRLGEEKHADVAGEATVAVIPGAGHVCNLERPETYADAVRRFVLSPGRGAFD